VKRWVLCLALACLLGLPVQAGATVTVLADRFGVTLETGSVTAGGETFTDVFVHDWAPTRNVLTTDYVVDDWYGKTSLSFSPYITLFGSVPSGGEPYDVEAIYVDNDEANLYLSIVTSFPQSGYTHPQVPSVNVPPGDITIGLGGGLHDYGIDVDGGTGLLYRTTPSDWYLWNTTFAVPAQGELTHFAGGTPLGPVSFVYHSTGIVENEFDTYLLEAVVPLSLLGDPPDGTDIYVHWVCGCRNDASGTHPILKLWGDIDRSPLATKSVTWSGIKAQYR
jgi:hypothetical protein